MDEIKAYVLLAVCAAVTLVGVAFAASLGRFAETKTHSPPADVQDQLEKVGGHVRVLRLKIEHLEKLVAASFPKDVCQNCLNPIASDHHEFFSSDGELPFIRGNICNDCFMKLTSQADEPIDAPDESQP